MLRRCCSATDRNVSGAVWEDRWSTGSGFVAVGFSVETPSSNSFNIMIRKMARCCGFLLATAEEQDWEWEDWATRCKHDGAGRVWVSPFHLLTPHHAPTFTDFLMCSHIPMRTFHYLAPSSPLSCM